MTSELWWYLARASGIVAWAFAMASVVWGMALSTRVLGKRPKPAWLLDLHRYLGGATVVLALVHVAALVADSYVQLDVVDVLVPFASSYQPAPLAAGVIALWLLGAVELTSVFMKRLPRRAWHTIHLASYTVAALGTLHLFTAGTDASHPALVVGAVASWAAVAFLGLASALGAGRRPQRASRATASPAPTPSP